MNFEVLIVGQDAEFQQQAESVFLRRGFKVICAVSGMQGLNLARSSLPDVTILDERLSDLDGACVWGILRVLPSTRDLPVIMLVAPGGLLVWHGDSAFGGPQLHPRPLHFDSLCDHALELLESTTERAALQAA